MPNLDYWNQMFREVSGIRPVLNRIEATTETLRASINEHSVAVGQLKVKITSCEKVLEDIGNQVKDHIKDYPMHGGIRADRAKTNWERVSIMVTAGLSIYGLIKGLH